MVYETLVVGNVYPRNSTPLSRAGAGINFVGNTVLAIQVNFAPDAPYPDARLAHGRILHIGEGKPNLGDQRLVGGNRGMHIMMTEQKPVPTFEKCGANKYRYLGKFRVSGFEHGVVLASAPEWKAFSFTLEPIGDAAIQLPADTEMGEFFGDIDPLTPPERVLQVVERFKRSKQIVDDVKKAAEYRCQGCGSKSEWTTMAGVPYCEAHHVIALGDDGFDCDANLAVLCANCHKEVHYSSQRDSARDALKRKLLLGG